MNGGHGDGVIFFLSCRKPLAEPERLHVTLEVAVQEAVEDGVDADGAHSSKMAQREQRIVGAVHGRFVVPVDNGIENIEWQPADSEGHHDGEQHDADALCLVTAILVVTHSLHHTLPLPQADVDLRGSSKVKATEKDTDRKRQEESGRIRQRQREKINIYYSTVHIIHVMN